MKTIYKDIVFARSDLIRLVGAPNESLRLIIIYYWFKYSFRIKISLLESLRSRKKPDEKLDLGKTSYKDLVFARGEFSSVVGAENESLRIILMYYMFKY